MVFRLEIKVTNISLYDCYTYELEKCLTAPLNDWLMNEKLLGKATIRGRIFFRSLHFPNLIKVGEFHDFHDLMIL